MSEKIKLTKALLERCLNKGCQVFAAMRESDPEAALAIRQNPKTRQFLDCGGDWCRGPDGDVSPGSMVYRLSPDTEPDPDPDWEDRPVSTNGKYYVYHLGEQDWEYILTYATDMVAFVGYVYPGGTVLKRLDLEYGVPTHVRFKI